jgi:hypothetical protein
MSIRDRREPPILSDEELREMFYGPKQAPPACDQPPGPVALCAVWAIAVLGAWGLAFVLWDIASRALKGLGL